MENLSSCVWKLPSPLQQLLWMCLKKGCSCRAMLASCCWSCHCAPSGNTPPLTLAPLYQFTFLCIAKSRIRTCPCCCGTITLQQKTYSVATTAQTSATRHKFNLLSVCLKSKTETVCPKCVQLWQEPSNRWEGCDPAGCVNNPHSSAIKGHWTFATYWQATSGNIIGLQ